MKFFPKFERSKSLMGIKIKDLEEFFRIFQENNLRQFRLKSGEFSITIEKIDKKSAKESGSILYNDRKNKTEISENGEKIDEKKDNLKKIIAPITGTFYTSPSPGQPPYVNIGDKIEKDTVVCIIESMKVMNEIKSNIFGTIKKRLIENGEKVKKGDTIFEVE